MRSDGVQPLKIAILAMGGEGGGVLADWIVDLGEANGYLAQTTSVPGVAQRTGATIYYVELFPRPAAQARGAAPVLALMPLPGDVDVVLASELMEAGRAIDRGLVTPDRTTLIASTHRVYSIAEKIALGDGRVDDDSLLAHGASAARRFIRFDMARVAEASGSVISAVLFGALSAARVLPFGREQFEATIERGGVGVASSLRAFAAGFEAGGAPGLAAAGATASAASVAGSEAMSGVTPTAGAGSAAAHAVSEGASPEASQAAGLASASDAASDAASPSAALPADPVVATLLERIHAELPASVRSLAIEGVRRLIDYQDPDYAALYLDRLGALVARQPAGSAADHGANDRLLAETARHLALWMSYEDTIRVADLKTRATRFDRVKTEVRAGDEQVLGIQEFMHPGIQEICETLPGRIGPWLANSGGVRRLVERLVARGRVVDTTSLRGFLMLWAVAGMRRWRRQTMRFAQEDGRIEAWLKRIAAAASRDPSLAVEIARCQRLVKGYSDTHARGLRNFNRLMAVVDQAGDRLSASTLRDLREAALADEQGRTLDAVMARQAFSEAPKPMAEAMVTL